MSDNNDLEEISKELDEKKVVKFDDNQNGLPDVKNADFKISFWKFAVGAIIIPIINAFGLILGDFMELGVWEWSTLLIVINIITIPSLSSWLGEIFNLKEKKLTANYEKQIAQLKDELYAYKIKSGLQEFALRESKIAIPDYDKYTDLDINT